MRSLMRALVPGLVAMGMGAGFVGCGGAGIGSGAALGGTAGTDDSTGGAAGFAGAVGSAGAIGSTGAEGNLACASDCTECSTTESAELFGYSSVPTFELTLPPEEWEYLQAHATDEEYTEACLSFQGNPIGPVGLRFKGSYGTLYPCVSNGQITCTKLSMKLKFNEIDPDLRFYELKRLNLHSMIHDPTKLHERLAYDLYRDMGVTSPRSAWAMVRINGEEYGLYSMVEQVDGRFTANRWPDDGDGNLYKEAWPQYDDPDYYTERLRTNEETPVHDAFIQFYTELYDAAAADRAAVLGAWTDLELWYRYLAVDDAIFNCDGITGFYSDAPPFRLNHNYYFYQATARDFFTLIPWDLDSTFTPWGSWSMVPRWTETPDDCTVLYPVWNDDSTVVAPGCDPVFQALATDLTDYRAAVDELLAGPFDEAAINGRIDEHVAHIADAIAADPLGPGTAGWEGSVAALREMIPVLRTRLQRLRDDQPVLPLALSVASVNDFESAETFGLLVGTQHWTNPSSTVARVINTESPLVGTQDLRVDFEYRNEIDPWQQWSELVVSLAGGSVDVSNLTGIRFWASADQTRNLRLNLDSPAQTASNDGIRKGWDVPVGPTPELKEVLFADAEAQGWAITEGRDPGDPLDAVLRSVTGLLFHPECVGRNSAGFLAEGTSDVGFLQIDDLEFFTE